MPCITCPELEKVKGSDKVGCQKHKWLFDITLAKKQKLCSNKPNCQTPTTLPPYNEQGPQWNEQL